MARPLVSLQDFAVPVQNGSGNTYSTEVIGNKLDDEAGDSLVSNAYINDRHIHSECLCWPTLANGINVASSVVVWTLGDFVTIIPASTVGSRFDIHWITVEAASAVAVYELHLFRGPTDVFIGRIRFSKTAVMDANKDYPFMDFLIPADEQIRAKLATDNAVADTVTISAAYHIY